MLKASNSDADSQGDSGLDGGPGAVAVVRLAVTGLHVVGVGVAIVFFNVLVLTAGASNLSICNVLQVVCVLVIDSLTTYARKLETNSPMVEIKSLCYFRSLFEIIVQK